MTRRKSIIETQKTAPTRLSVFFKDTLSAESIKEECQSFITKLNADSGGGGAKIDLKGIKGATATFNIEGGHTRNTLRPLVKNNIPYKQVIGIDFDSQIAPSHQ